MRFNVSEITDIIKDRRTIVPENYTDRKVHKELIGNIIDNALWAPTHGKTQPWRFTVFTDNARKGLGETLAKLYKENTPAEDFSEMKHEKLGKRPLLSSVVIAVAMSRQEEEKIPEVEEIEAVACAVQNMLLTATAYGLGSFWSTPKVMYSKEFHGFLGLEENDKCLGLIYLGYTDKEWPKGQRRPIEYVTNWRSE